LLAGPEHSRLHGAFIQVDFRHVVPFLIALIGILRIVAHQSSQESNVAAQWIDHTHQVLMEIKEIQLLFQDLQLEQSIRP
jgi:hypothetical protein